MDESLTQQRRVGDEAIFSVKPCWEGRTISLQTDLTVPPQKAPANSVPAAAVIRGERALSGFIGRKGRVGGPISEW